MNVVSQQSDVAGNGREEQDTIMMLSPDTNTNTNKEKEGIKVMKEEERHSPELDASAAIHYHCDDATTECSQKLDACSDCSTSKSVRFSCIDVYLFSVQLGMCMRVRIIPNL